MKNTFLVLNDPKDPKSGLRVATLEEWDQILKDNRHAPRSERRYFICDCIEDCGELDRMYIETGKKEFDKWHWMHTEAERKRIAGSHYSRVSLDECLPGTDDLTYADYIPDPVDRLHTAISEVDINLLKERLSKWKAWAPELLDCYLAGNTREAAQIISSKFDVSARTVPRYKPQFERMIMKFFENP